MQENKISPGQEQWWNFKAANFDSVLLFKMGGCLGAQVGLLGSGDFRG